MANYEGTHRFFVNVATKDSSNLTELNATDSVNNGFMDHADWLAHVMRYAVVMHELKRRPTASLLDVGCGRFPLLTYLWRNRVNITGMHYVGLDMRAKELWLESPLPSMTDISLIKMNIVKDPIIDKQFGVVVCTEMLEHIEKSDASELMRRLRKWTAPDGLMFLSSPNLGGSDTVANNHMSPSGTPREWTYEGKVRLIEQNGFEIVDSIGTFIRLDHIPYDFWTPYTESIKERLPNSFFRVFAAAAFPAESNNAMFICKPV